MHALCHFVLSAANTWSTGYTGFEHAGHVGPDGAPHTLLGCLTILTSSSDDVFSIGGLQTFNGLDGCG